MQVLPGTGDFKLRPGVLFVVIVPVLIELAVIVPAGVHFKVEVLADAFEKHMRVKLGAGEIQRFADLLAAGILHRRNLLAVAQLAR